MLLNFICSFFLVLFIIKWCQKFGTKEIKITDYNELCFIVFLFNLIEHYHSSFAWFFELTLSLF